MRSRRTWGRQRGEEGLMPTRQSQRGELLAKVCGPTTPDETERLKIREDGEQMKGKEKGGAGGGLPWHVELPLHQATMCENRVVSTQQLTLSSPSLSHTLTLWFTLQCQWTALAKWQRSVRRMHQPAARKGVWETCQREMVGGSEGTLFLVCSYTVK